MTDNDGLERLFGLNLKMGRERRAWSQADFARKMVERGWASWRQNTVSRVEKGEQSIRATEAREVAKLLEVDFEAMWQPSLNVIVAMRLQAHILRVQQAKVVLQKAMYNLLDRRRDMEELVLSVEREGMDQEGWTNFRAAVDEYAKSEPRSWIGQLLDDEEGVSRWRRPLPEPDVGASATVEEKADREQALRDMHFAALAKELDRPW